MQKTKGTQQLNCQVKGTLNIPNITAAGHPNQKNNHSINCIRKKQQKNLRNIQKIVNCDSTPEIAETTMRRRNNEMKNRKGLCTDQMRGQFVKRKAQRTQS